MKSYILLVTLLIIIFCRWSSASSTQLEHRKPSDLLQQTGRQIRNLWTWIWKGKEHTFTERCFGVARRLKFAIPMIIFKLGVIVTILAFLTIFSLKSLGLLLLLVMLNSTGVAAKWAYAKHQDVAHQPAQALHFHVHPKDFAKGGYSHYGGIESDLGWYDRNEVEESEHESLEDRLKKLNIYGNYLKGK